MLKYENVCFYTKIHNRILRILNKRSNFAAWKYKDQNI